MSQHRDLDLDRLRREEVRWRVLRALDAARPGPLSECVLYRALCDVDLPVTPRGLRREIDYLRGKLLVEVNGQSSDQWIVGLTAAGVDVVEYTVDAPTGVDRPPKYW